MIESTITLCFIMLGMASILSVWRVIKGPRILDRVVAYDTAAMGIIGKIVLLSILWKTGHLIEIILIFSLLGFMGSLAFVTYLNTVIPRQRASSAAWKQKKLAKKLETRHDH